MDGIHPLPLPVIFPYFSINTETVGINIEIRAGRDGIFSVRFHPQAGSWETVTGAGVGRKMTGGGSGRVRSHGERIGQITTVAGFTKMGGGPCRRKKHHHQPLFSSRDREEIEIEDRDITCPVIMFLLYSSSVTIFISLVHIPLQFKEASCFSTIDYVEFFSNADKPNDVARW